ncbi:hypothetical protein EDD16DRAFT_1501772, partial [Pisolithus croceorrhizus]
DTSNFSVDTAGKTILLDFGAVGILPESFASYMMLFDRQFHCRRRRVFKFAVHDVQTKSKALVGLQREQRSTTRFLRLPPRLNRSGGA